MSSNDPKAPRGAPPLPPASTRVRVEPARPDRVSANAATLDEVGPTHVSSRPPPSPGPDPLIGTTIDSRYVVDRVLGEGGMGIVYAGRHKVIDKKVAIKALRGDMAKNKEITERFLQEARAASSIGNPHIIDISDFGTLPDGSTYFVMEFLDGTSLSGALAQEHPMPVARVLHVAKQIAGALAAAHTAGIVHRDLKPDNVMLVNRGSDKDFVKILDFGIAKVGAESKITRAGSIFGTPHYMSPEQAAGASVDSRTDVYALGVILYEMASGKVPFDADNFMGILTQHMYKAPVPILAMVPPVDSVPPGLDAVIQKSLSKKPEQRYPTMEALAADLEKVEKGLVPDAVPEMMARSGGFHVPADYFRTGMPAAVPGMPAPQPRPRWPLYGIITAVVALVGISVFVLVKPSTTNAKPAAAAIVANAVSAVPSAAPAPIVSAAPAAPVVTTKEVLLAVEPADAKVTRDGKDLGSSPIALTLADGEVATLVVAHNGFKSQTITVNGSEPKKLVRLAGVGHVAPKPKQGSNGGASVDGFADPFVTH